VSRLPGLHGLGHLLDRDLAERLAALTINEEKNLGQLVMEIGQAAARG
jgi:hypothetical protein